MRELASRGFYCSSVAPFGYRKVYVAEVALTGSVRKSVRDGGPSCSELRTLCLDIDL